MKKSKLLIIGRIPPPIGGVTIHVNRLLDHLNDSLVSYDFIHLKKDSLFLIFKSFFKYRVIHLHTSNVWLRFIFSIYSCISNCILITTYHGNLGRYNTFLNWMDILSVKLVNIPIVLNQNSYKKAKVVNKNVLQVPAFIPPNVKSLEKNDAVLKEIKALKSNYKKVYCTNAFDVTFDKDGNEIYGISSLINIFNSLESIGLIISDPSGNYKKFLQEKKAYISNNIRILNFRHSFYSVLELTDGFIRSTTTDGDSLSVKEALHLGKDVYCSDCVDRPLGTYLFETNNYKQLKELLTNQDQLKLSNHTVVVVNGFDQLKYIYTELIRQ